MASDVATPRCDVTVNDQRADDDSDVAAPVASLRHRSVRGASLLLLSQSTLFVGNLVSTAVLARLLAPSSFGLFGMAVAMTGVVEVLREAGLSTATIQRARITSQQVSSLFWWNAVLGGLLAVATVAAAPLIGAFYHDARVPGVVAALAMATVFRSLAVQHQAVLARNMAFGKLAAIDIAEMVCSIGLAIAVAAITNSYWALVVKPVSQAFFEMVFSWSAVRLRVGRPNFRGASDLLRFGGAVTGSNVLTYVPRNADNMLIGWRWGAASLGYYANAYRLLLLPLSQINAPIARVAIPALSRMNTEPGRYRRAYTSMLRSVTTVTTPAMAFAAVTADWIVLIALGPQWRRAIPVFAWLAVVGIVQTVSNALGWLFVSQGRGGDLLRWSIFSSATSLASFVIGLPHGPVGVAAAYVLSGVFVRFPVLIWYVGRRGPVRARCIVDAISFPVALAAAVAALAGAFRFVVPEGSALVSLVECLGVTGAAVAVIVGMTATGRSTLFELKEIAVSLPRGREHT